MPFLSHTLQANGIDLHYYRSGGNKPPLLLLHGLTDDATCWLPITDALAQDYDLIMPDVRGHGQSARIDGIGFASKDLAADVAGLITALGLQRPAVLGHSLGGSTGLILAATYPELVGCLLMEDPPLLPPPTPESEIDSINGMRNWANQLRAWQTQSLEDVMADEQSRSPHWTPLILQTWAESKHRVDAAVLEERRLFPSWQPLLQQVQCPVLLLYGDKGSIVNEAIAQEASTLWKNGEAVQIAGAGHSIRRDNVTDYLAAVRSFLNKHYAV